MPTGLEIDDIELKKQLVKVSFTMVESIESLNRSINRLAEVINEKARIMERENIDADMKRFRSQ